MTNLRLVLMTKKEIQLVCFFSLYDHLLILFSSMSFSPWTSFSLKDVINVVFVATEKLKTFFRMHKKSVHYCWPKMFPTCKFCSTEDIYKCCVRKHHRRVHERYQKIFKCGKCNSCHFFRDFWKWITKFYFQYTWVLFFFLSLEG